MTARSRGKRSLEHRDGWNEDDHPRDDDGKFTDKGGGSSGNDSDDSASSKGFSEAGSGEWGKIYRQKDPDPIKAAEFLQEKKDGMVENAFTGKNKNTKSSFEVGLCWGHKGFGLEKVIEKHIKKQSDFNSVDDAMRVFKNAFENGKWSTQKSNGRSVVINGKYKVVLEKLNGKYVIATGYDKSKQQKDKKR